jgi:hypothetical protein
MLERKRPSNKFDPIPFQPFYFSPRGEYKDYHEKRPARVLTH